MNNDTFDEIDMRLPDFRHLAELDAKKRGFSFDNPEDARKIFRLLQTEEKQFEDIKKYFKRIPKTKKEIVSLVLKNKKFSTGNKMKKLLNRLKLGIKTESELINHIYSKNHDAYKSKSSNTKALVELIRATNKKLYKLEKGLIEIIPKQKRGIKAYYLKISSKTYGFKLVE